MATVAQIIGALRAAGLSQTEIARRTGVAQWKLSRWESGATPAAADDALRLQQLHVHLLGAAPADLNAVQEASHGT